MILIALFTTILSVATASIERSVAQADAHGGAHVAAQAGVQAGDARKSFEQLKSLAGTWEAHVTITPPQPQMENGLPTEVSLRVTSRGNALVHEMKESAAPDDPTKYDHPVTMIYLDSDRLLLTHYCDAGNRPRMVARVSPDGRTVEFDFLDVAGGTQYGHMHHAVFTIVDANHHIEDWTYMTPGDKPIHAHMDLQRK
jgi:phage tail protein X